MFAIIDVETTGGRSEYDRITDICVIIHDGLTVVDEFSSLVNPERPIPEMITRLTGITNEMVSTAPKFFEIARRIIEMTEGCVFVAHNVQFDYGFVTREFASLGYKYKREQLCTVRLSRKLIPGKRSYSLGNLCQELGIVIHERHRAAGDARATAELFNLLIQLKASSAVYKKADIKEIQSTRVDKIKKFIVDKMPEEAGVYYFYDKSGDVIYVGKSNNMRSRVMQHFASVEHKSRKMKAEVMDADYVKTGTELIALLLESEEIKRLKPRFNRARKRDEFPFAIVYSGGGEEPIKLKIERTEEGGRALKLFTGYASAREMLDSWIEELSLCWNYCGINDDGGPCFNHQIKKCYGLCCGQERVEDYNLRARRVLEEYAIKEQNYFIAGKVREEDEQSLVFIRNGRYAGYGFLSRYEPVNEASELSFYIKPAVWYPDADDLVRAWMKKNRGYKIIRVDEAIGTKNKG